MINKHKIYPLILILPVVILLVNLALPTVNLASANFSPPQTTLPTITILNNGTIQSSLNPLPISINANVYTLTGNITDYALDIQISNITFNGAGYWLAGVIGTQIQGSL